MKPITLVLLVALVGLPGVAWAQRQVRDEGVPSSYNPMKWFIKKPIQPGFFRLPGITKDYALGPGDELEIFVSGLSQDPLSVAVSNVGEINIPLLGRLNVNELTTEEVEARIAGELTAKGLIENPEVLVVVAEHQAKPIYVIGEVDNPGQYVMSQQLTLMEAVFLAGGLDFTADRYGYLHRRPASSATTSPSPSLVQHPDVAAPGAEVIKIDLQPLKEGGVLNPDIPLRRGDVLVVPRRQVHIVYLIGDLKAPGPFEIPAERTMKVSQAISAAGGPTRTAKLSEGALIRFDESGRRSEFKVNFAAVMQGKQTDIEVQPNDVIYVPGSGAKRFGLSLLSIVPNIITLALVF
jgi:polysaccharide biosynthesis/export protein